MHRRTFLRGAAALAASAGLSACGARDQALRYVTDLLAEPAHRVGA